MSTTACSAARPSLASRSFRASRLRVSAGFTAVTTKTELQAKGGRLVVDVAGKPILLQSFGDDIFAVSNKCPHLGLSLQGKTALLSAKLTTDPLCIVCPAHATAFDLKTGAVCGEWCPSMPSLPFVGKIGAPPTPLPTFAVRVTGDSIEVDA